MITRSVFSGSLLPTSRMFKFWLTTVECFPEECMFFKQHRLIYHCLTILFKIIDIARYQYPSFLFTWLTQK